MIIEDKLSRVRSLIKDKGASALILTNPSNMGYLLGYEDGLLAYIDDSAIKVITPLLDWERARELVNGKADVVAYSSYKLPTGGNVIWGSDELIKVITSWIKPGSSILIDDSSKQFVRKAIDAVNAKPIDASADILDARSVKTPEEVELIKGAINITLRVLKELYGMRIIGMRERDLAAYIYHGLISYGGDEVAFNPIVGSGPNGAKPHHTHSDRRIGINEAVVIDIGVRYRLYCSDLTRTLVTGPLEGKLKDAYNAVIEASRRAISVVKPGVKASEVDAAAREVINEYGFAWGFIHSLGHGVGVEVHERPAVGPNSNDVLKEGNVITIEPGIYIKDVGGVRVENMILVTESGAEVLTRDEYAYV
ncbi:M24 family metallopeptidase [Caldivirga sp. UBA161]|uniref:M24 family metallopeptidase n=1 Tax=Caldivirga sp. UBA161 TaxID=1915569 RepID=UPI0025BF9D52|nr:Xaa-Pro peptidase family protein [Caldivirga sp. UBA161]